MNRESRNCQAILPKYPLGLPYHGSKQGYMELISDWRLPPGCRGRQTAIPHECPRRLRPTRLANPTVSISDYNLG